MIRVFSSYACDFLTYENNREIPGWPALWIEQTLDSLDASYVLQSGESAWKVRIDRIDGRDRGTILATYPIPFCDGGSDDIMLISTLANEFSLSSLTHTDRRVCIDVQWYLRGEAGKKYFDCSDIPCVWSVFLKATQEEFSYLRNTQYPNHTFLITNGGSDVEVRQEWCILFSVPVRSGEFSDTIGAGDTFFSSFVYFYENTGDIYEAIQKANEYTYNFLSTKNSF